MNEIAIVGVVSLAIMAGVAAPGSAEDWPMWRGPRGDGTSIEQEVPLRWSATDNIAWKVTTPGVGHASPIVFGDHVFLVTCTEETQERVLLCFDRKTGKTIWRKVVIRAPLEAMHRLNSRASSTPATDGEFIYVSFLEPDGSTVPAEVIRRRSGDLRADNTGLPVSPGKMCVAAYDMAGNRKWITRPGEFASVWGYCASPVVFEDKVIVNGDHDGDAYIAALDRTTGETVWRVDRKNRIRSHCTPLIREVDGRTQMMVAGSHSIVSYDPQDGSEHWHTVGPNGRAVASPVFSAGLLFVSTAYPDREMLAVRPDGRGDVTATHIAWRNGESASYVPSPIAVDDYFLVVSDHGIASCFDASTGKRHWRERIGKGHTASLITAGGLVYFLSDEGVTRVVRPGKQLELIAENPLGEHCYASPAISRGQIFLRSEKHLFCIGEAGDCSKLVLELLFEGDLADTSESKSACTSLGTVAFVDGKQGKCASFDGRSWVDTGLPQKELGEEFTVECWVNPGKQQSQHADVFGNHVGEGRGFVLQQDGTNTNQFLAAYGAGAGRWVTTEAVPLAAGRWQHVALVKTRKDLRVYLNGILVAAEHDTAPARPSPMPVAVGLGYSAQDRCFRGLIDDFRIWNKALTDFGHAGIDPAAAQETLARCLQATPRPAAGALAKSWTLATDDTRLTLGVTAAGEMVVGELSCPATGWNWITNPVAIDLWPQVEVAGRRKTLRWQFVDAAVDESDGRRLTLRFACDEPALEITSQWHAREGPGPIHHSGQIKNRSAHSVTIGEQPTFDLDLTGATDMWCFHSDGGTPDPVGVYRHSLTGNDAGRRYTVRTAPTGEFNPYVVLDANQQHGVYLGLEWSFCRIEAVTLSSDASPTVRVRAGNFADVRAELAPDETFEVRPGFLGAYCGDLDDAGNRLRRWLLRYRVPDVLRQDPSYPKVQWNAFGATGKTPGSWDPVEKKYYPLIDDIAPLGFEEVMIDVGWWQGNEPDSDQTDWPSGMKKAADYAHEKGMRFGLYWTDNLDMASPAGRRQRADRVRRLFQEYHADMWRSDSTRGAVIGSSYAATHGFYQMVDALAKEIPNFQWENCSGGGRIKDYGAMGRAVKIFSSDNFSVLGVRQAFYDGSYAFHPIQLMGHLGMDYSFSPRRPYRPRGIAGMKYAFRAMSMGAPEWFIDAPNGGNGSDPWTEEEKEAVKAAVATYKARIRPLVREADLYHILPRPDGRNRDGIEYYDPAIGKGVVYLFQPSSEVATEAIRFKGLDASQMYQVRFEDSTHPPSVKSAVELMDKGLQVTLEGAEVSELIFFEVAQ